MTLFLALAFAAAPTELAGTWAYSGGAEQAKLVADKKEEIAGSFNFAIRPVVRAKLNKPMNVDESITFTVSDAEVTVAYGGAYPRSFTLTAEGDGYVEKGGTLKLFTKGDRWVLDGANDEGGMARTFSMAGSAMTMVTTLRSPQLEGNPSWTLGYTKK